MKKFWVMSSVFSALLFTGCNVERGSEDISLYTSQEVEEAIVDGKTTKEDIFKRFGATFAIILDEAGREQWKYHFRTASLQNQVFVTKQLIVVYDENDIVVKHVFYSNLEEAR